MFRPIRPPQPAAAAVSVPCHPAQPPLPRWVVRRGPAPPENAAVEGGEWLTLAGRDEAQYHRIHRFIWRGPGLDPEQRFCRQVSGFFGSLPGRTAGCGMELDTDKID